ncbi:hypothetical protein JCM24511_02320 [Saitozyma sp. JCM 24511]|nr:hypothetical protein JCM24511_02320 [Saitozyma sp. JCM 24511]
MCFQSTIPAATLRVFLPQWQPLVYRDERSDPKRYRDACCIPKGPGAWTVEWMGPDDPENPYNWSTTTKIKTSAFVVIHTVISYTASSAFASGLQGQGSVTADLGVSNTVALLGLSLFVLGYGMGPMVLHPLSDVPSIGRLPVYLVSQILATIFSVPCAIAPNIGTLLVSRYLQGLFSSPPLATGGATLGDMWTPGPLAYALACWGFGAVVGPAIGPILGGYIYSAGGWRWIMWALLFLNGLLLLWMVFMMPETSGAAILYRRACRLEKRFPGHVFTTAAMIEMRREGIQAILVEALWRPFELIPEPTLLVYNVYLVLVYGMFYLFFEAFPVVFGEIRGFSPGQSGLAFLGVAVMATLMLLCYCVWLYRVMNPVIESNAGINPLPELRLALTPYAAAAISVALFGFGWTGQSASIHWIAPVIFSGLFACGGIASFQTIFAYLGDVYFKEIGFVLTLNDLFRGSYAAGFPLFAHALYTNLGVGPACSLLGAISVLFIPVPIICIKW